jgi:hypothetical protein
MPSELHTIKDFTNPVPPTDNCIILTAVIKDEILLLDYFLRYYSSIGITHFIFIDNNSSDGSKEYLASAPYNILLLSTNDSYKENDYGVEWVRQVLDRFCKDKWCVAVDADELINVKHLNLLTDMLEKEGANICKFYLLDMYAKNSEKIYEKGAPFLSHSNYYDKESSINNGWFNGVRKRTMNVGAFLRKFSLFKYTFYDHCSISSGYHHINFIDKDYTLIKYSKTTQILLHFKFIKPNLHKFFEERVKNNQDWNNSIEYKRYCEKRNYNFYSPDHSLCIEDTPPTFTFIHQ